MNLTATGPVICRAKDRQERQKINREEEGKWETEMRQRYGKRETEKERFDKGETEAEIDKFSMNQRQVQSESE